jgi:hypothetical protein
VQRRTLIAAVLLLVALSAWVFWVEREDEDGPGKDLGFGEEDEDERVRLFASADEKDVQELRIEGASPLVLRRVSPDDWVVVGQPDRPADDALAAAAARALARLEYRRKLEAPPSASDFGLGVDALKVSATLAAGGTLQVTLGGRPPVGTGRYAQSAGDPAVYLVDDVSLMAIERDPAEFRDRRLLPLDRGTLSRVNVRGAADAEGAAAHELRLARRGTNWYLESEAGYRADSGMIDDFLRDLIDLRAKRYAPEGTAEDFGLAEPRFRVELGTESGSTAILAVGGTADGGDRWAITEGTALPAGTGGEFASIPDRIVEALQRAPEGWRALDLVDFEPESVRRITWSAAGTTWEYLRRTEEAGAADLALPGDAVWKRSQGPESPAPQSSAVEDFLREIDRLRAVAFAEDAGGDGSAEAGVEAARLDLEMADGKKSGITLLRGPVHEFVRIDGEPGLRELDAAGGKLLTTLRLLDGTPAPADSP